MMAAVQQTQAADMPDLPLLRGGFQDGLTAPTTVWQGFYIGGQAATGSSDINFTNATQSQIARLLANTTIEAQMSVSQWPVLGKESRSGNGYGAFAGYNAQWDDIVLGIEANYMHGKFGGSTSGSMSRSFTTSDGYTNAVTNQSSAAININDMGSARLRAGYVWNSFMPYAFGGAAVGTATITRSARIFGNSVNVNAAPGFTNIPFDLSSVTAQHDHFVFGYMGGLGVDVMLWGGAFARLEWEYLRFTAPIDTSVNTVRAGLGYKF
jgi:opacity protein-like surface antigen